MLFAKALDAVVIDLYTIPCIKRRGRLTGHCLRILGHFLEHMLEPSGRDDL
jgi:hypothetical protein